VLDQVSVGRIGVQHGNDEVNTIPGVSYDLFHLMESTALRKTEARASERTRGCIGMSLSRWRVVELRVETRELKAVRLRLKRRNDW